MSHAQAVQYLHTVVQYLLAKYNIYYLYLYGTGSRRYTISIQLLFMAKWSKNASAKTHLHFAVHAAKPCCFVHSARCYSYLCFNVPRTSFALCYITRRVLLASFGYILLTPDKCINSKSYCAARTSSSSKKMWSLPQRRSLTLFPKRRRAKISSEDRLCKTPYHTTLPLTRSHEKAALSTANTLIDTYHHGRRRS